MTDIFVRIKAEDSGLPELIKRLFFAMATNTAMKELYSRLQSVGVPRKFVRDFALPEWWDDEAGENPAGLAQAKCIISQHLGVEYDSLEGEQKPFFTQPENRKFKKRRDRAECDLEIACAIATRAAVLVASAVKAEYTGIDNASDLRQKLLDNGCSWIGLGDLLSYCWESGIPVIHISNFPTTTRCMDGMVVMTASRPVIVICKNSKKTPWLSFILAHEMGHIAHGHVGANSILVDEEINESSADSEEAEADQYALNVLSKGMRFVATGRWPNAERLAELAIKLGHTEQIDPGHIVLNYAHRMGARFFGVANAALNIIEQNGKAAQLIFKYMSAKLQWDLLPSDSSEFLSKICNSDS